MDSGTFCSVQAVARVGVTVVRSDRSDHARYNEETPPFREELTRENVFIVKIHTPHCLILERLLLLPYVQRHLDNKPHCP
jgi:hypothetical protein